MDYFLYKLYHLKLALQKVLSRKGKLFYADKLSEQQQEGFYPRNASIDETLEELLNSNKSLSRFGDGEFFLCFNTSIGFQKYEEGLKIRLKEILANTNANCLVTIVDVYVEMKTDFSNEFWCKHLKPINKLLNFNTKYYNTNVSRYLNNDQFDRIKTLWDDKDVIFVVGKNSRFKLIPELFGNIKSHAFVYGKPENAWSEYDAVLENTIAQHKLLNKDAIVIASLGPAATVLCYDLAKQGIRALDLGHISTQYLRLNNQGDKPEDIPISS